MPRIKFCKDFDFSPIAKNGTVTIAYKAGMDELVTQECADAAISAKRGKLVKEKSKTPEASPVAAMGEAE